MVLTRGKPLSHTGFWGAMARDGSEDHSTVSYLGAADTPRLPMASFRRRRIANVSMHSRLSSYANLKSVRDFVTTRRNGSRHLLGLFVCALLVFFAVEAKLSVYVPQHKDMNFLASTKVWQNDTPRAISTPPVFHAILAATIAILLPANEFTSEERVSIAEPRVSRFNWFFPDLSVRPPPAR